VNPLEFGEEVVDILVLILEIPRVEDPVGHFAAIRVPREWR
jgi:hypothetical protein